jgi:hypothetical protein
MVDKIIRVPLRTIWKHEANDFTKWLTENIDVLSEVIGRQFKNPEREQSTGNFYVDIKADDEVGDTVIIENQLGKSDHDHLGKIITYLAAFGAKTAIWIVAEPKEEHINAITWLNEGENSCDFYLIKLEGIKIGNSQPAPLIVGPSEEGKSVGKIKQEDKERHKLRLQFWTVLLEIAKGKHGLFGSISPSKDNWIAAGSGKRGIAYVYWITQGSLRVELRIDRGKGSEIENLQIFHALQKQKEEIESRFGEPLEWDESEGNRMCAIRKTVNAGGYRSDESEWRKIATNAVEVMIRLEKATKDIVNSMKV